MERKRLVELLAYAKVCFEKCTSPFELMHLVKKCVTADECRDLSHEIASIIENHLFIFQTHSIGEIEKALMEAEKDFAEAQRDLYSH